MKSQLKVREIEKFDEPMLGIVEETIAPYRPGRVKGMGSYWPARFYEEEDNEMILQPDEAVFIIGITGITLLVVPVKPGTLLRF
ncbi:MAG: NfeD family protein [Microcoleaceae cyanobacterium]|jgi:membrane protein implicated in regulation of membrane protease activity